MTGPRSTGEGGHASSVGQNLSGGAWLDAHFEACRPEYEAQMRAVGIQPGWRVLDAACGTGPFLPWLAALVGPRGVLAALDLAPENAALAERRAREQGFVCPVEVATSTVLALPYPDASFDAVWFANTAQYLSDEELLRALAEFRRVVRPGGLVAVKDSTSLEMVHPLPPFLLARLEERWGTTDDADGQRVRRILHRTPVLRRWLERAGLADVWQRATLIDRWAPFAPAERQFLGDCLSFFAVTARRCAVSEGDRALWARVSDPASPANPGNSAEGYWREGNILAVGTVPRVGA